MFVDANAAKRSSSPVTDGLPPERRRWALAAIFTALAMASLDTAIANIALPAIAADLGASPADVVWVVNVYQIALVATLLPLGRLARSSATGASISAACCCLRSPPSAVPTPGRCRAF